MSRTLWTLALLSLFAVTACREGSAPKGDTARGGERGGTPSPPAINATDSLSPSSSPTPAAAAADPEELCAPASPACEKLLLLTPEILERVRAHRAQQRSGATVLDLLDAAKGMENLLEEVDQDKASEGGAIDEVNRLVGGVVYSPRAVQMITGSVDVVFFRRLAETRGDKETARYLALKVAHPPTWEEQVTDESYCTRLGNGALVKAFQAWDEFHPGPDDLQVRAAAERSSLLDTLTGATCLCDDAEAVLEQYEGLLVRLGGRPASDAIEERLKSIRARSPEIRFRCTPG